MRIHHLNCISTCPAGGHLKDGRTRGLLTRGLEENRAARLSNQHRLRELRRAHGGEVTICCGHDPHEFEQFAGRTLDQPVTPPRQPTRAAGA